jgi:hypothetical protein
LTYFRYYDKYFCSNCYEKIGRYKNKSSEKLYELYSKGYDYESMCKKLKIKPLTLGRKITSCNTFYNTFMKYPKNVKYTISAPRCFEVGEYYYENGMNKKNTCKHFNIKLKTLEKILFAYDKLDIESIQKTKKIKFKDYNDV